jgi:hypothetical protein
MERFENVDVIASLDAIMRLNTAHYQSDFKYDADAIRRSMDSQSQDDRILLWMSRPSGTWCFRERDAFLRETEAHFTWEYYKGSGDAILAYAVESTGKAGGKVTGNLCELDYQEHAAHIAKAALPVEQVTLTFRDGQSRSFAYAEYDVNRYAIASRYGEITAVRHEPAQAWELQERLRAERDSRAKLPHGKIKDHIRELADDKVYAEARRIAAELQKPDSPNSPNRTHFMAQLSPEFCIWAGSREHDRLFAFLPYKSLTLSGLKEQKGLYAMISGDENRDRQLRQRKPSVKKQLQTAREAAPSAPGPTRKKGAMNHDENYR